MKGYAGLIVHVRIGAECVAGVIVDPGRSARVRLFRNSGIHVPGSLDTEGDYRSANDPMFVPTPEGSTRHLPTWHIASGQCVEGRYDD